MERRTTIIEVGTDDADRNEAPQRLNNAVALAALDRLAPVLGRVDELFDDDPCGHEMNYSQKGLTQFLIPCGNASKLFEVVEEPFHLLA